MSGVGQMAVVAAGVGMGRRKVISQVPPEYLQKILNERVYIFNLSERTFGPIARTHSNLTIPGRGVEAYSTIAIGGRVEYSDAGIEDAVNQQVTSAKEIAEDLCGWCNNDLPRCDAAPNVIPFVGVWWEESSEPTRLAEMVKRKQAYNKALVSQADMLADTDAGKRNINDMMRQAAREMGLKKTWLYEATEMAPCPACGTPTLPGIAICSRCNAVLDPEKARKFFPERFIHKSGESFSSDAAE